jgi:hypothetical protein
VLVSEDFVVVRISKAGAIESGRRILDRKALALSRGRMLAGISGIAWSTGKITRHDRLP